jgi:nucleoside-diphosphate-sugar epimerase
MRVLVAGATGAIGRPVVRRLVAAGHRVSGLTRSPAKMALVKELGATPVLADALDAGWLEAAVAAAAPEAVIHLLTALPPAGPRRYRDLEPTNRLRRQGTANLLSAAANVGARRFVAESVILVYGDRGRGRPATEEDPVASTGGHRALDAALAALRSLEDQVGGAAMEGVILRYGLLYGPGTTTDHLLAALRRRVLALPRTDGLVSWIHVEDAAAATVAALERADAGAVLNVVDDEPASIAAIASELAAIHGLAPPRTVPPWLVGAVSPYLLQAARARIPAANARIKRDLRWTPAYPTYRDGLRSADEGSVRHGDD